MESNPKIFISYSHRGERQEVKSALLRARLFGLRISDFGLRNEEGEGGRRNEEAEPYPWESPQADLEAAEKLINDCGYHRRDEELADAKRAILGQELK